MHLRFLSLSEKLRGRNVSSTNPQRLGIDRPQTYKSRKTKYRGLAELERKRARRPETFGKTSDNRLQDRDKVRKQAKGRNNSKKRRTEREREERKTESKKQRKKKGRNK